MRDLTVGDCIFAVLNKDMLIVFFAHAVEDLIVCVGLPRDLWCWRRLVPLQKHLRRQPPKPCLDFVAKYPSKLTNHEAGTLFPSLMKQAVRLTIERNHD